MGLLSAGALYAQRAGDIAPVFDGVSLDEQLGEHVPLDLTFRDENGEIVRLGDYFDGTRPVALNLVYFDCPMLCSIVLMKWTDTLKKMAWVPGDQFEVVTVSFSSHESPQLAAKARIRYLKQLGKPAAASGWHFLTGTETNIRALTDAVGFHFKWVEEKQQYAHPTTLTLLSGDGKITRYLQGVDYPAGDVRKALVEASAGKVGSTVDRIALYCFQYDPKANSYVVSAFNLMRLGGGITILVLALMLVFLWRRERRRHVITSGPPG